MDLNRSSDGGLAERPQSLSRNAERLTRALRAALAAAAAPSTQATVGRERELEQAARAYGAELRRAGLADRDRLARIQALVFGITPPYYRDAPPRELMLLADQVVAWCIAGATRGVELQPRTDVRPTPPRRPSPFGPYDRRRGAM